MKKTILFVHQSADLYGSDKVLLALVSKLDREKYLPVVIVPVDGLLVAALGAANVECHVLPVTRLARSTLSLGGLLRLPANLIRSLRAINLALSGRRIDLVHSNTFAVLSGAIWASWHRIPHIWHVHEIILRPKFVRKVYALLLSWFADCIICVSQATKDNLLQDKPTLARKIRVVWNGLDRDTVKDAESVRRYRDSTGMREGELLVALVGRINRWKGQRLLVEAATLLWQQGVHNLRFVFVGSVVPWQEHFLDKLKKAISDSPARQCFDIQPFTRNVWSVWDACDIAVVPSTEPEPFGLVALEAMIASKPVIAANHGGLSEIVVGGETGLLIPSSDAQALANAIYKLAVDKKLRLEMGRNGEKRYHEHFTLDVYVSNVEAVYESLPG